MSGTPEVLVHRDAEVLASAVAERLVTRLVEVQADRGLAHLCLTGGSTGIAALAALAASPARDSVDWSSVHLWWGDERYLPAGHPDRNDQQARDALLDAVPLDPAHVHAMPSSDSGLDVDEAAAAYAEELRAASRPEDHAEVPSFDVCLLGVGPDAHVNSLFPQAPAAHETQRWVVGVHGSPKPPPLRVTLTFRAIRACQEVWLLAGGPEKADAIRLALTEAGQIQVPAAGARGRERTLFLLDEDAAGALPPDLRRLATPCGAASRRTRRPRTSRGTRWGYLSRSFARASLRIASPSASLRRSFT
jgi:6-phosphogluconolactonase